MDLRGFLFVAVLIAGASYWAAPADLSPEWLRIAWKGAGVALLALWAALHARTPGGWAIAVVLALGALGDVLLEAIGLTAGAIAFMAGHVVAIGLYLAHRRTALAASQRALAAVLLIATPLIAWSLPADRAAAPGVTVYATVLGAMAAAAWTSRFPRFRVGAGAVLFVVSDLLMFARMGPLAGSWVPELLVWPTYFAGQALIAWGVVSTLGKGER